MKKFGLIGYPLAHSFSEKYFKEKFAREKITDSAYLNFPLKSIEEFPALLKENPELAGLNVTIPYKQCVMPYLDELDETAKAAGAVNCIKIQNLLQDTCKLKGYNTDTWGFEESLKPLLENHHRKALVLGSGGAARAVCFVLKKNGIEFLIVSRNFNKAIPSPLSGMESLSRIGYEDLSEQVISEHPLIIQATPVGMNPDVNKCPDIPYQFLTEKHLLYDLVYNPSETLFLKKGKERGAKIKNGLEMLHLQAEKSWEIWENLLKTN